MMENMEAQLSAILSNPQMMEQIMSIAQGFQTENAPEVTETASPEIDFAMVKKLTSLIGKTGIDSQQKTLLHALAPYLSNQRVQKLEKAMRAARLAGMASVFFSNTGR